MRVGFIVHARKGHFSAMIGDTIESEGDNDSIINVIGTKSPILSLEEAQAFLLANTTEDIKTFIIPITVSMPGMIWLSEITSVNPGVI